MGELRTLDSTGDTKTIWDPDNEDEVAVARESFNTLMDKGYIAYKVDDEGGKGDVISSFDPRAGKIIMSPPIQGG